MARDFKTGITINTAAVGVLATTGTPADLGVASRGSSTEAARADHVHNTVASSGSTSLATLVKWGF